MNHKSISPNPQQPVDRVPAGQLPNALAELSEAALNMDADVLPSSIDFAKLALESGACEGAGFWMCSYEGDDE